jgi:hypothetical protein
MVVERETTARMTETMVRAFIGDSDLRRMTR